MESTDLGVLSGLDERLLGRHPQIGEASATDRIIPRDRHSTRYAAAKVPEILAIFWAIKILTTGMGEAASDYLAFTNLILAGLVGAGGLLFAMVWQFRVSQYQAWPYWTVVAMVAVTGTMGADFLHRFLGISYVVTTPFCGLVLAAALTCWWLSEHTVSIHSITTRRRELFYWATVMASFAFGTAAGDLTASSLNLGYFKSGLLFGVLILIPWVARRRGLNAVVAFWAAYILTRPLGASFADWFAKPPSRSGLALGTATALSLSSYWRRSWSWSPGSPSGSPWRGRAPGPQDLEADRV